MLCAVWINLISYYILKKLKICVFLYLSTNIVSMKLILQIIHTLFIQLNFQIIFLLSNF